MNSKVRGIEDADVILLIGTNPKLISPVLNARLRKAVSQRNVQIGLIGSPYDMTYEYDHIGTNIKTLVDLVDGRHPFASKIANVLQSLILLGKIANVNSR